MNQLAPFLPYILSAVIPPIAAVMGDSEPRRRWLRVLVVIVLTLAAAYLQVFQSGVPVTPILYAQAVAQLATGSQVVHRLFGHALGKLEAATGPGLGALVESLMRVRPAGGDAVDGLDKFKTAKARLDAFLDAGAITREQYDSAFALAQEELIAGVEGKP